MSRDSGLEEPASIATREHLVQSSRACLQEPRDGSIAVNMENRQDRPHCSDPDCRNGVGDEMIDRVPNFDRQCGCVEEDSGKRYRRTTAYSVDCLNVQAIVPVAENDLQV